MSRPLEGKLRSALKRMGCEVVGGICSCRSVASGRRSPGFGPIWRGPWKSTGIQRCSEWCWDLAHCSPDARERVMWLLLEPLSHRALAAEMLFQEVGRIKQEEKVRVSKGPGKGAGLCLKQAWAQGKAVISAEGGGIQGRKEGPRLEPSSARPASSAHYFKPWCYSPCRLGRPVETEALGITGPSAQFSSVPTAR